MMIVYTCVIYNVMCLFDISSLGWSSHLNQMNWHREGSDTAHPVWIFSFAQQLWGIGSVHMLFC
jgi:hypothetical protein